MAGTTASNLELRDWISVRRHDTLAGLGEDRVGMVRRRHELRLRTKSLAKENKTISRESTPFLTAPTEPTEEEHPDDCTRCPCSVPICGAIHPFIYKTTDQARVSSLNINSLVQDLSEAILYWDQIGGPSRGLRYLRIALFLHPWRSPSGDRIFVDNLNCTNQGKRICSYGLVQLAQKMMAEMQTSSIFTLSKLKSWL